VPITPPYFDQASLLILILMIVALMITPRSLLAQAINRGDRVFSGQVIDNDVIMYGDDVILAGNRYGQCLHYRSGYYH
jgi:hypothetical protein